MIVLATLQCKCKWVLLTSTAEKWYLVDCILMLLQEWMTENRHYLKSAWKRIDTYLTSGWQKIDILWVDDREVTLFQKWMLDYHDYWYYLRSRWQTNDTITEVGGRILTLLQEWVVENWHYFRSGWQKIDIYLRSLWQKIDISQEFMAENWHYLKSDWQRIDTISGGNGRELTVSQDGMAENWHYLKSDWQRIDCISGGNGRELTLS